MSYTVKIAPTAERQIKKLTPIVQRRVVELLMSLEANPRAHGTIKMRGKENRYRARLGDYRIIYEIKDNVLIVLVLTVSHRKDVYRRKYDGGDGGDY